MTGNDVERERECEKHRSYLWFLLLSSLSVQVSQLCKTADFGQKQSLRKLSRFINAAWIIGSIYRFDLLHFDNDKMCNLWLQWGECAGNTLQLDLMNSVLFSTGSRLKVLTSDFLHTHTHTLLISIHQVNLKLVKKRHFICNRLHRYHELKENLCKKTLNAILSLHLCRHWLYRRLDSLPCSSEPFTFPKWWI